MPPGVAPGGHGNRQARERHADQRREAEKLLGAFQRRPDLWPRVADAVNAQVRVVDIFYGLLILRQVFALAAEQEPVLRPAAGQEQFAGGQIGPVHQQARRDIEQIAAPVGFVSEDLCDPERGRTEADAVAGLGLQALQQAAVEPDGAGFRHLIGGAFRAEQGVRDPKPAPDRIAPVHGLDLRKLQPFVLQHHAAKALVQRVAQI